jgi:Rod binding domain-containing protein
MAIDLTPTNIALRTGIRSATAPQPGSVTEPPEDAKLRKAAEDFEGLLLAQMLQSIRESALGGWQENHDQGGAVALEMAETQLARVMASQGGLGIARTLTASMRNNQIQDSPVKTPPRETGESGS